MTLALHPRVIVLIIGLLVLVGFQGCAHTPPSSLPQSIQPQLGKIGVALKLTGKRETLEIHRTGRGTGWSNTIGNVGGGAGAGFLLGLGGGALCGPAAIVCMPVLGGAGAIGGAIVGGLRGPGPNSESGPRLEEAESTFKAVLTDMAFEEVILSHTIADLRGNGYNIDKLPAGVQRTEQDQSSDPASPLATVGVILEIKDPIVILALADASITRRSMILSAQIRLIRTVDDTVLDDRIETEEFGTTRFLDEWTADDAKVFREDVSNGAHRLAITISERAVHAPKVP